MQESTPSTNGDTLTLFKLKNIDPSQDHRLELIPVGNATLTQNGGGVTNFVDLEPGYGVCLGKLPVTKTLNPVQHHYSGPMISGLQIQSITVTDADTGEEILVSGRVSPEQTQYVSSNSKLALAFDKGMSIRDPETEQSTDNVYLTIVNKQATQKNLKISIRNSDGMPVTGFGTVNLTVGPADAFNVGVNLVPALWGEDGKPQTAVTGQNYPFDIELTYPDVFPTNTITYLGENALTVPSTFTPSEDATVTWGRLEASQPLLNIDRVWFSGFKKSTITGIVGLHISTNDQLFWWNWIEQTNDATLPIIDVSVATTFNNQVPFDVKYLDMDTDETVYLTPGATIPAGYMAGKTRATNLVINSTVQTIEAGAFASWTDCESIEIKDGVTSVDDSVFSGCTNVKTLTVAGTIAIITSNLFSSMKLIENLTINDGITTIQQNAFNGNTNLLAVNLPDSVVTVGDAAFYGLVNCLSVSLGSGLETIGEGAFGGMYRATNLVIQSAKHIANRAFENWYSFKGALTLPVGLLTIGTGAFSNWFRCSSLSLPEGLTSIGGEAFSNWFSGYMLNIPTTVTTLKQVFQNWYVGKVITFTEGLTDLINEFTNFGRLRQAPEQWVAISNNGITESEFQVSSTDWPVVPFTTENKVATPIVFPVSLINCDAFNGSTNILKFVFGPNIQTVKNVNPASSNGNVQYFFRGTTPPTSISNLDTGIYTNIYVPDRAAYQASVGHMRNFATWKVPTTYNEMSADNTIIPQPIRQDDNWSVQWFNFDTGAYETYDVGTVIPENFAHDFYRIDEVIFNKKVRTIGKTAFQGNDNIRRIRFMGDVINGGIWNICEAAFAGCNSIARLNIPYTIQRLGPYCFAGMYQLLESNINVTDVNKLFYSVAATAFSNWPLNIAVPSTLNPDNPSTYSGSVTATANTIRGSGQEGDVIKISLDGTTQWGTLSSSGWSWVVTRNDNDPQLVTGENIYVDLTDIVGNAAPQKMFAIKFSS